LRFTVPASSCWLSGTTLPSLAQNTLSQWLHHSVLTWRLSD
jgi:hypothetical protein